MFATSLLVTPETYAVFDPPVPTKGKRPAQTGLLQVGTEDALLVSGWTFPGAGGKRRRDWLRPFFLDRRQRRLERNLQHLVHRLHKMQLHRLTQVFRDFSNILLVVLRQDYFKESGAMSGKQLLFQSADRKNLAAQRDLTSHCQVAADRNLAQRARDGRGNRDARRRSVFRNGALRHVHVQVKVAVEVAGQSKPLRARAYI